MSEDIMTSAFVKLRRKFLQFTKGMLPSEEDAEDALQDAFVRLWQRANQLDSEQEVEAMTVTTLRNMGIDRWRKRKITTLTVRDEEENPVSDIGINQASMKWHEAEEAKEEAREKLKQVEAMMERELSPQQLEIIHLREYEERSYAEIASMLQMKETAVRMQVSRARKAIRDYWKMKNVE